VDVLSKLEIYTFGSAAAHLSNPCLRIDNPQGASIVGGAEYLNYTRPDCSIASPVKATLASLGHRIEDHERVIPHVEHYALASDIFARCGVLHTTRNVLDSRFCGRVFVLDDRKMNKTDRKTTSATGGGFLLNEHYLDHLFPSDVRHACDVLSQVVEVDIETAEKREFTAQGVALLQKSINQGHHASKNNAEDSPDVSPESRSWSSNDRGEKRASWEMAAAIGNGGVGKARIAAKECEGKTVKQLSRLWRYAHGGRPVGEGVTVINGVGNGHGGTSMSGNGVGMVL
jgi:hypothetical protein